MTTPNSATTSGPKMIPDQNEGMMCMICMHR